MATQAVKQFGPEWCSRNVVVIHGQHDTRIETGEDYDVRSLGSIFLMEPGKSDKLDGDAFIPSEHRDYDARNHAAQREHGSFVALTGDVDSGNHSLSDIEKLVRGFSRDSAWLIYSSAHARPGDMRWRVIIPLAQPVPFDEWYDAQNAFFRFMERAGVDMDQALDRAGQLVFLPNVPVFHGKSGDRLRCEEMDWPLYYERATTGCNAQGLDLSTGPIASGIAEIRSKRADDERERQRLREEAERRRANRPRNEGAPIIEDFNRENPIARMFELYGYEQSPRHSEDWRSPNQTSESYATRIMGDKWVSLSASDAGAGLGEKHKSGCFGDAYDLFVHYEHSGDHKAAFRTLYSERRASAPLSSPPPIDSEDPGWTEPPEDIEGEPVVEPDILPQDEGRIEIETVDAFDFEESDIPRRPWVIPGVMLSGYTHMLAAPGGSGKSLFTLQMAITLARGEPWGTFHPRRKCRTLIINVEDDLHEQRRRLSAARRVMQAGDELRGMIDIVPNAENIVVATRSADGRTIRTSPVVETLVSYIEDRGIDVLIVDPFTETFEGDENDNSEVKWAMKIWRDEIARRTGCVVYLVHHTVKYAGNGAGDANVIRGAGAIVNSTRISATLMPMTQEDADMLGVDQSERHLYVRYDDAKANQSLKTNIARWFQKVSIELGNGDDDNPGDEVGALVPWSPPDAFESLTSHRIKTILDMIEAGMPDGSRYRLSTRGGSKESGRWVGCLLMSETDMNEATAKKIIKVWHGNGVLVETSYKCPVERRTVKGLFAPESNRPGVAQ
ncbi:MAG: AAA family ATPase [Erythrobacter sp.]|nr:AAA family ATPase [Erythrobacter sp.]